MKSASSVWGIWVIRWQPICGTGVAGQPVQKGINFGSSEVSSVTVRLELVEELTHPVRLEGVLRFLYAELLKHLEVAGGPLGIWVKWGHRPPVQLLVIMHILPLSAVIVYIHHQ